MRLYEQADLGGQLLKKVTGGGTGTIRFTTAEALGTKRTIVAQVEQAGLWGAKIPFRLLFPGGTWL